MRPSTLVLSALLVVSLCYAGYLQIENARLKQHAASESAAEPLAQSPVVPEADEVSEPSTDEAATAAGETETPPTALAQTEAQQPQPQVGNRRRERIARMMAAFSDPQMRLDMVERAMGRIDESYADFFKSLDLTAPELETLRALMAERSVTSRELRMRGFAAESEVERALLAEQRRQQSDLLTDEIAALLGPEAAADLENYTDSLPYRESVEALASSLSFTDTPMTSQQSEALVQAMRSVSSQFEYTNDLSGRRGVSLGELSTEDLALYFQERETYDALVISSAASTLSAEQIAVLAERQLAERERDQRRAEFMRESNSASER